MSNDFCETMAPLIDALSSGRFDDLTAEQMESVAAHLDACGSCAGRLADVVATPQAPLSIDDSPCEAGDLQVEWEHISGAVQGRRAAVHGGRLGRLLRPWSGLSAAAVLLLAVIGWQMWPAESSAMWDLNLAGQGDIEIESVETHGDASFAIMNIGDDDGAAIIWVSEEESST